jgi:hypothetical protein
MSGRNLGRRELWLLAIAAVLLVCAATGFPFGKMEAKNLATDPQLAHTAQTLILASGFQCGRVSSLYGRGDSPYGPKLEAYCGEGGGQHYAVYPKQRRAETCGATC